MPLFQPSIQKKYLADLPQDKLHAAWERFVVHFQDPVVQENIRNAKEEEYQEGFVRDLFVDILGYTLKPKPDFNMVMEQKSTSDSTKSDGAILSGSVTVIAVIELKDTTTTDLDKVVKQAFNYKHQHKECRYVITSNFQHLRLYISDSIDYVSFDLFRLTKESFALMYCCLQQAALQSDVPLKMKQQSVAEEENVTKKLYADYSRFRKQLFGNIVLQNPQYNKLDLFKKTQKLLDRFLFILFAEDRMLLPPNSVRRILSEWENLRDMDAYVPLYDRFKKYFGYLNTGHQARDFEVFAYNGGLFKPDDILDSVLIDDQLLFDSCKGLSNYDFESEVDVNILGHIFEHSLSEIEKIEQELAAGLDTVEDPEAVYKSKRKKDGVFYTPRYITKYIVENTIGALCVQKREEMKIVSEDYVPQKRKADTLQLLKNLEEYRQWLLQLTICDPACGSGAFLNQALEFLIDEHQDIDAMKARLFGDALMMSDVETSILENNLYGVDINQEATDIAKLSLWLRTARKGRKLNDLNSHIKCGNSLIDDPAVAGDKAFNWQMEFPEVFAKGGFDVVIGNPPYVDIKALEGDIVKQIFKSYKTANNRINLFSVFIEKSIDLLKTAGKFSFIIPSSILTQESYKPLRNLLLSKSRIDSVVRLPNESFGGSAGEVKVDTIILSFTESTGATPSEVEILVYEGFERISEISSLNTSNYFFIKQSIWNEDENFIFRINATSSISSLVARIESQTVKLVDCAEFCLGLTPYDKYKGHTPEQIENRVFHSSWKKDETYRKLLAGNDVERYFIHWSGEEWISYGKWLGAPREDRFFKTKRILVKQIIDWTAKRIWAAITEEELYNTQNSFNLIARSGYYPEYLIALINSTLMSFYHRKKFLEEYKDRFQKILIKDCKEFPIKELGIESQSSFVDRVLIINTKQNELHTIKDEFLKLLIGKYGKLSSRKLQIWPNISFGEFLKELEKQKIKLSLSEQSEWMQYFESEKAKANAIQDQIKKTDREIDAMVYELYGLTEEEIRIVEES
ncbi:MAG: N-6 DNA methylase [Saprospiraceae bacterium]|nr:N-6 DNA methylase [Candidatus Opimibacter skivensis]MBP6679643.1 N-6 DNA methylase [Saprospiraceae bacterium]MBP8086046.1 N-6 DNA methylase [Saprospiraceae bacterium]